MLTPRDRSRIAHATCAWSRAANPTVGEYGEPTTLFVAGEVPDMD